MGRDEMSNRDIAIDLINQIPEYKLNQVIFFLQGAAIPDRDINDIEEVEPDEWDLEMIAQAEKVNDGTTITLEELAKDLNLNV